MLVSSLEFLRTDKILLGLFCFRFGLLWFEALCRVGVVILSHTSQPPLSCVPYHLGEMWPRKLDDTSPQAYTWPRRWQNSSQWLRGRPSAEHFILFTTLEADSQRKALVLVYNICLPNFHEVRRPIMKIMFREMFENKKGKLEVLRNKQKWQGLWHKVIVTTECCI